MSLYLICYICTLIYSFRNKTRYKTPQKGFVSKIACDWLPEANKPAWWRSFGKALIILVDYLFRNPDYIIQFDAPVDHFPHETSVLLNSQFHFFEKIHQVCRIHIRKIIFWVTKLSELIHYVLFVRHRRRTSSDMVIWSLSRVVG